MERRVQATAGAGLGRVRDTILTLFLSRETGLFNGLRWTRRRKKFFVFVLGLKVSSAFAKLATRKPRVRPLGKEMSVFQKRRNGCADKCRSPRLPPVICSCPGVGPQRGGQSEENHDRLIEPHNILDIQPADTRADLGLGDGGDLVHHQAARREQAVTLVRLDGQADQRRLGAIGGESGRR
jgi:hypothetical protein